MVKKRIEFCKNKNCCPKVEITDENYVKIGDEEGPEGVTVWTMQQFEQFIEAAKMGDFDDSYNENENT
jgi:hypothetical protein